VARGVSLVLFLLVSGDALPIGLGLIGVGAIVGLASPRVGAPIGLGGLLFATASAVPLHAVVYGALAVAFAVWLACIRRVRQVRHISTAALLVVLVLVSTVVVQQYPSRPKLSSDKRPVFVLGDSLSAGLGGHEGTWPTLLADRLGRPVQNLARPGAQLADGLLQARALPNSCVVLIELGGNDLLGGVTAEAFAESLRRLLRQLVGEGRSLVMFELPLLPLQNRYGQVQRQVGTEFGVRLIPRRILAGAVTLPGHTTDGLHLSTTGHRWLAEKLVAWL
jgi:acyl-CoA thioesterase-1